MSALYQDVTVRLAELARDGDVIQGATFLGCRVVGPAVIVLLDGTSMVENRFLGDAQSLFLEIVPARVVIGCVGLAGCRFERCSFERVGIAGPPDVIRAFLQGSPPRGGPAQA